MEALEAPPPLDGANPYGDGRAAERIVRILASEIAARPAIAARPGARP